MSTAPFRYADLFAGVGGFAAVFEALGGKQTYSVEIDGDAARVYRRNWGHDPLGDVTEDADTVQLAEHRISAHDVIAGGFPCQPFSKSGAQRGMDETRGTLFFNIMQAVKAHRPTLIILENVRNLTGPRHLHEWELIIDLLREEGYQVSETPAIFSPHRIAESHGGSPQVRERVFITATRVPPGEVMDPDPAPIALPEAARKHGEWHLEDLLDDERDIPGTEITPAEREWIAHWEVGVQMMRDLRAWQANQSGGAARALPGFPIWIDSWRIPRSQRDLEVHLVPAWKANFLRKNWSFYDSLVTWAKAARRTRELNNWVRRFEDFPESRRKLEWQARDEKTLRNCVISLRPSGLRVKQMTHLPALVAITQTPILMPRGRRLSPREAARLQGLPDNFDFGGQRDALTYKQMGNGVNTGVVWNVLKAHVERDAHLLEATDVGRRILEAVRSAPANPSERLARAVERAQRRLKRAPNAPVSLDA